jgi:hypothetical protein
VQDGLNSGDAAEFSQIKSLNEDYMQEYANSWSVRLLENSSQLSLRQREVLLGYAQSWSDGFQRMLATRCLLETDESLYRMAEGHLAEEIGHQRLLAEARGAAPALWDPIISACSSWIVDSMAKLSPMERLALVHLVLEGSGLVALTAGRRNFSQSQYFALHSETDVEHLNMGYEELARRNDWSMDGISEVLRKGWAIVFIFTNRLAQLATQ